MPPSRKICTELSARGGTYVLISNISTFNSQDWRFSKKEWRATRQNSKKAQNKRPFIVTIVRLLVLWSLLHHYLVCCCLRSILPVELRSFLCRGPCINVCLLICLIFWLQVLGESALGLASFLNKKARIFTIINISPPVRCLKHSPTMMTPMVSTMLIWFWLT